ncbi:hypothetical protein [Streptomyces sp. NPDC055752]
MSLAVTAWGTFKSAQVANAQLAEVREGSEAEVRAQASRVSMWSEGTDSGKELHIVIANRSPDPVYAFLATLENQTFVPVGNVPPCTRVRIPGVVMSNAFTAEGLDGPQSIRLGFYDSTGRTWLRPLIGKLERASEPFDGPEPDVRMDERQADSTLLIRNPQVAATSSTECG